jgi:hypothetical protein
LVYFKRTTRFYISEDRTLQIISDWEMNWLNGTINRYNSYFYILCFLCNEVERLAITFTWFTESLIKKTPWLWSASELCRPSDRRFLAK